MLVHPDGKCHSLGLKGFGKDSPLYSHCMGDHGARSFISIRELIAGEQHPYHPRSSPIQNPSRTNPSPHRSPYPGKTLRQEPAWLLSSSDNTSNPPTASWTSSFHRCWASTEGWGAPVLLERGRKGATRWVATSGRLGAIVWPWGRRWG